MYILAKETNKEEESTNNSAKSKPKYTCFTCVFKDGLSLAYSSQPAVPKQCNFNILL
jgi:hypothetical protein